jgi:para-aminobenzoate synthetase / 4-amino-4-deoxychorismate lyase
VGPMPSRRQPDPSQGVFETMLVIAGVPVAPEAHLARLQSSLEAVYGTGLPGQARGLLAKRAEGLELGRVRLTFTPADLEVEAGEIDRSLHFPKRPIALRTHEVRGGLGCHKWADRARVPTSPAGEAALLVDGGEVLEASRANVFAVRRGAVFTPPLDGRILPGVTRATTIELAQAAGIELVETTLAVEDLGQYDEVFLTNSIRGIEAVGSIDGSHLAAERPLTRRLEALLRDRWENESGRPEAAASHFGVTPP